MHTKVSKQGNVIEVTRMSHRNTSCTTLKLSADEYMVVGTGEILEYEHSENRADSKKSLYRSFRNIRALVNTNCPDPEKLRWVTLTYAENMTDSKRLYQDYKKFWLRFKYRFPKAEYIIVPEPQERGAWHLHALFIFPDKAPFIPNDELASIWGHGFVRVQKVDNVDNVGAYLSAYIADVEVPLDSPQGVEKILSDGTKKKFIKGGRLHLYPPGMNLYRFSRGISKPVEEWSTPSEVSELVAGAACTYRNEITFTTEEGFEQKIIKEFYNTKRCGGDTHVKK